MERDFFLLIDGNKWPRCFAIRDCLNGYGRNSSLKAIMLKGVYDMANICHAQIVKYHIQPDCGLTSSNKQAKKDHKLHPSQEAYP